MTQINFKSLQNLHETLLKKQPTVTEENQQEFTKEVREYIEQAKRAGSNIPATRERDQVRANLRYWGNYIYSIDKTFPDTELAPSIIKENRSSRNMIGAVIIMIGILIAAIWAIRVRINNSSQTATNVPVSAESATALLLVTPIDGSTVTPLPTLQAGSATETPAPESGAPEVLLTSPQNGENVPPRITFTGTYTNLRPDSSIHILIVKSDTVYAIKASRTISQDFTNGSWDIDATLYQSPDDLERAESFVVVPAVCFENSCRETLAQSVEKGIPIDALPSQFTFKLFQETSRVVYRNAYHAINETRLVYSIFYENESSYDLYTSKPDGSDPRRIKFTPDVSEIYPNLSPDGTKIVYVSRHREAPGSPFTYSIAIMDSNGDNDEEITERTTNVIESPQWSPDSSYISYEMGEPAEGSSDSYWSVHAINLATKEDQVVSQSPKRLLNTYRYHSWIPGSNIIVFNTRNTRTATSGFVQIPLGSSENETPFFDTEQEDIQPSIKILADGYLLTYTTINPDGTHDIFAVLDSDRQLPMEGTGIRLTYRRAGETIGGVKTGSADYPISDPDSDSIYYMRNVNIFKLNYVIREGRMEILPGTIDDGERNGDLVVETGLKDGISGFDVGLMSAFFPIE